MKRPWFLQKNRVDLSSISEVRSYITEWPHFWATLYFLYNMLQKKLFTADPQKLENLQKTSWHGDDVQFAVRLIVTFVQQVIQVVALELN